MEDKASLMVEISKATKRVEAIKTRLSEIDASLQSLPDRCKKEQVDRLAKEKKEFEKKLESARKKVSSLVDKKVKEVSKFIDSCKESGPPGPVSLSDIEEVEEALKKVYPKTFIEGYICSDIVELESDEEAEELFEMCRANLNNLHRNNFVGSLFVTLMTMMEQVAEKPQVGMKIAGLTAIFIAGTLILFPFLFLTVFAALGLFGALQGRRVQALLQDLYSVKSYISVSYDEEKFAQDKEDIMDEVTQYLQGVSSEAMELIDDLTFREPKELVPSIVKKYDIESKQLQASKASLEEELHDLEKRIEVLEGSLEKIALRDKTLAESARTKYLHTITWDREWYEQIFIDVTKENKIKVIPYKKANGFFYASDPAKLQSLSRLIIYQSIIHMHPEFASVMAIDYKYNGGELIQFQNLPSSVFELMYSDDDRAKAMTTITNKIQSRTTKILGSCASIEDFNKLMESYNTVGEYYVVVHIFGLTNITEQLLRNLRNGPKVGFFFKFYWTTEELKGLGKDFPLGEFADIYEITDNPLPRTSGSVKRLFQTSA